MKIINTVENRLSLGLETSVLTCIIEKAVKRETNSLTRLIIFSIIIVTRVFHTTRYEYTRDEKLTREHAFLRNN